jgi:VWFA-related protein
VLSYLRSALSTIRVRYSALLMAAAFAFGQQTTTDDAGLVIRSNTSLVQVRVVAEDSQGRPVADLQKSDFEIQDDRKSQPITLFAADRGRLAASPASSVSSRQSQDSAPAPPGYSVLLLDWLNTTYTSRVFAQEQVLKLLKSVQPRQQAAIYLLAKEPRLLHDFTSDMDELRQAVEDAGVGFPGTEEDPPGRYDARYSGKGGSKNTELEIFLWQNRVLDSLHTLEVIAEHLAHVPGRKSLIWLSAGFPLTLGSDVSFTLDIERALAKLNRADIAVDSVNACGLSTTCRSYDGLSELPSRTGGTIFAGRNDLDEGMRLALDDMRISYTLGFHVPEGAAPGVHEIRVRVSRPGVKLRYRESYELAGNGRGK